MPSSIVVPRPASTVILTRDSAAGLEVFLMQRSHQAVFMPGVFVFPGGVVDPMDACASMRSLCNGIDDIAVNRRLGVEQDGLAYLIAAIRESFEEVGLLLAHDNHGDYLEIAAPDDIAYYAGLRERLNAGQLNFADVFRPRGLSAAVEKLAFFSRWITPVGYPRRYDTHFFVAAAPERQIAVPDGQEAIDHIWISPAQALQQGGQDKLALSFPTISTLQDISNFASTEALLEYARQQDKIEPIV